MNRTDKILIMLLVWITSCASGSSGLNNDVNNNNTNNVNNINNINNINNLNNINNTNNTNTTNNNNCTTVCEPDVAQCSENMLQFCSLVDGCYDWVDNTNCASSNNGICEYNSGTGDAECVDTCDHLCDAEDDLRCDSGVIQICSIVAGCREWALSEDCVGNDQVCEINTSTNDPECVYNCSNVCEIENATQCGSNFIQTCTVQTNTCMDWEDTLDCGLSSKVCEYNGSTATCETAGATNIYFTEYIKGSSYNKALEIYFKSVPASYDTSNCEVHLYMNGSTSSQFVQLDSTTVNSGDVFVICHNSFTLGTNLCDQMDGDIEFNGDDAVALICSSTIYDVIGQIGVDPGTEWNSNGVSTDDSTLRRKSTVTQGDPNGSDAFLPDIEWIQDVQDTFTNLGIYPDP
jgi:hypothetical protein